MSNKIVVMLTSITMYIVVRATKYVYRQDIDNCGYTTSKALVRYRTNVIDIYYPNG